MSPAPIVEAGVLTRDQYRQLYDAAAAQDEDTYIHKARAFSMGNVPAFSALFLGREPLQHLVDIRKKCEPYLHNMIVIARYHAKTVSWGIDEQIHDLCYSLIEGSPYEETKTLIIQETKPEAVKTIEAIKMGLLSGGHNNMINKGFCEPLGIESFKDLKEKWRDDAILMKRSKVSRDYTIGGIGIGGALLGGHPKKVLMDDVQSTDNARSMTEREKHWQWATKTLQGMMGPTSRFTLIGTPKYPGDLIDRYKKTRKVHVVEMAGISQMPKPNYHFTTVEDDEGYIVGVRLTDQGLQDLKAPWPCPEGRCEWWKDADAHLEKYGEHKSPEWQIFNVMLSDYAAFCSEIMLMMVGGEDARIQPDMLRFYSHYPSDVGKLPGEVWTDSNWDFPHEDVVPFLNGGKVINAVHGWDHAIGKQRKHDETSWAGGYRTDKGDAFFVVRAGHWDFEDVWSRMVSWFLSDPVVAEFGIKPSRIVTEGINFQRLFGEFIERDDRLPLGSVHIVKNSPDKDTALADSGLLNLMLSGKAYFDIRDKETINQLLTFSPGNKNLPDDRVDSTRLCFNVLREAASARAGVMRNVKEKYKRLGTHRGQRAMRRRMR